MIVYNSNFMSMNKIISIILIAVLFIGFGVFLFLNQNQNNEIKSENIQQIIDNTQNTQEQNNTNQNIGTQNTTTQKCIITLFNNKYDVTSFRREHPGGNIFKCGEDMTEEYRSQHGLDLKQIERFKI